MIALVLLGCGSPANDWSGDWDGTFDASNASEPWPARLIDVLDAGATTEEEDGRVGWREWRGTFELQADEDHWVAPMRAYVCEDDVCTAGADESARGDYWMLADLNAGNFVCTGTMDGDTITCDGQFILPGNPSIGPVTLARADKNLLVGEL